MTLPLRQRLRVRLQGEGMAMAAPVMIREPLIGIRWRLIAVALGMHFPTARDRGSAQCLTRMHRRRHHQRTGEQPEQNETPTA
jgi:hypothetical protein